MTDYLTYLHLLTPLHTGGSSQAGNLLGIAREVHTGFPYLPSSSLRGKIRSQLEAVEGASIFFGHKIKEGQQPTEGEVWFADATLLFFPIASLSHHLIWITCPLWLSRWNRWLPNSPLSENIATWYETLNKPQESGGKVAFSTFETKELYLQTALLKQDDMDKVGTKTLGESLPDTVKNDLLTPLLNKLVILNDEDCAALVEIGLQREVRVALQTDAKLVQGGSFRSEEAIPPEAVLFFPWGMKLSKKEAETAQVRAETLKILGERLQFGGLEGLGQGWAAMNTVPSKMNEVTP
ncbi:type III-B CRISPR module RAMP protein Cmr4 [Candidatus Cyanaurora vandensis]|uniref:type III-B CRISPR module RAMP protein Cmr4 n=1 Tax=Candidatus Cyanaurora vandensis TaxID=2714958 RepID=UPI00257F016E|nr:type III-B CRISPR module RAMP protein Cmr4 [Candidatus Cyanaurora vandensis]